MSRDAICMLAMWLGGASLRYFGGRSCRVLLLRSYYGRPFAMAMRVGRCFWLPIRRTSRAVAFIPAVSLGDLNSDWRVCAGGKLAEACRRSVGCGLGVVPSAKIGFWRVLEASVLTIFIVHHVRHRSCPGLCYGPCP